MQFAALSGTITGAPGNPPPRRTRATGARHSRPDNSRHGRHS